MPEEVPKFDPNKPYKDVSSGTYKEVSSSSTPPPFDPNKPYRSAAKQDFQEEGFSPDDYTSEVDNDNIESTLDFIQKNSRRLMRDDEKDILRDMFKNPNATKEDISDAIVTLQGKKAKQIDNTITMPDYYMDINEKGVYKPIALTQGERAPKGKEMVSIWGTQKSANDDAWYTDVAKTAFNIIPGVVGGVVDVLQLGTELVTGEESEWLKQAQIGQEALKFKKDADIEKSIYNTEDINKFTDLFDPNRINLSPEVIWGTALSAAGFMGEMLVPSSLIAKGAKGYKAGKAGLALIEEAGGISKIAQKASVFAGSFMTQIGDVMESSSEAGLEGRVKALYDLTIGTLLASVDAKYDVAGKILTNKLAQDAKKEILSEVGKKVVKDKLGNVTKESLNEAAKEAMTAYTPIVSSFAKNYGKDVLDEVKDEVLQSFIEKAGQNVYDKLSPQEKANFGTDAFSAKSFGEYINSAVSGLVGAGAPSLMSAKGKQQVDYKAQSNSAYDTVMQGEEAVKAFKTNITNAFQSGQINKEDYDNAILKVGAYDSYEKTTKDLTLNNENKKKLFELSLQKENLKAAIKDAESKDTEGHSRLDKMNPAELGLHNAKVKQAKALQDEIDLIVTKSEVLQQPEVAEKVVEKVVKAEEKATEGARAKEGVSSEIGAILGRQYKVKTPVGGEVAVPGKAAYEVPKKVLEEKRKMKDFSTQEWNIANASVKQAKLADALEEVPEKTVEGTLQQDNKYQDKKTGLWVQTYNLTLPNGKTAQFASSMVRFPEEGAIGGFRGNTYEENLTDKKSPIGQKLGATVRTLKDSGRKVIFIWNADEGPKYGKHIGMVREDPEGKSVYGAADLDEMADLRMINMGQNPNAPAPGIFTPKEPTKGGPKVAVPVKNKEVRDKLKGLGYSKPEIQAMEPQEANDIVKEQREKSKVKKQPLEEVEIKDKKEAAKVEKKIADLRAQEQAELKREIPNIDAYKVDGKVDESLIKDPEDLKKYKEIYENYNKKISPLLEKEPAKEKGKVVVKREGIGTENYKNNKNQFTGRSTSKVIPNGEKIKGTYKLVEANDVLASHNEKNFAQTDNFPKREDGSTLNDRDYQKDKNAQNEVIRIANKFDDRAISNIPTVTQDGIVVDGNNRTMSRKLAAENKTDLGYKEALKEKLDMYGFTEKQFNSLKNPFLIFEMEQDVDYTTELFSKFNVAEKKEKSPIDKAVEISKTIDERGKRLISDLYANVSTPSEVTSNPVKVRQVIKLLQNLGILQPNEIPRYFDITKSTTTRDGVSFLESIVLGSSLTESAIRSLDNEGMGKIKTQLLSSIAQLTKNSSLDENSLKNEISKVVDLINTLKGLDLTLDEYISNPDLFGQKQPISVNDYAIAVAVSQSGFKKWLANYNDRVGQMDMFKGDILTKKDILEETIRLKTGKTAESIRGIERLQKAKVKPATLNKFEKSVDLFYKTKDADGASKKRSLAAERREFLEKNPTVKYIDDNMKYIYKQLEEQNIIERKGECP